MRNRIRQKTILSLAFWLIVSALIASAQDARESLGPKDEPAQAKGTHPLTRLMATLNSSLRPELRGKHPRVYVTEAEIVYVHVDRNNRPLPLGTGQEEDQAPNAS